MEDTQIPNYTTSDKWSSFLQLTFHILKHTSKTTSIHFPHVQFLSLCLLQCLLQLAWRSSALRIGKYTTNQYIIKRLFHK